MSESLPHRTSSKKGVTRPQGLPSETGMRLPFSLYFSLEHMLPHALKARLEAARNRYYPLAEGTHLRGALQTVKSAQEAADNFRLARMPLIWKGGAKNTAVSGWTPAHLGQRSGKRMVKILALPGLDGSRSEFTDRVMTLAEYLHLIKTKPVYLRFSDLLENAPELREELPMELLSGIARNPSRVNLQFFLGPKHTMTPLHAEMNCNIFIQVFGRKRWIVYPPEAMLKLQPPSAGRFYFFSPLNPLQNTRKNPADKSLEGIEFILEPGDILLCPPLVWHTAENLSVSCSVGYKYNQYLRAFRASPLLFAMNTLARNPSYFTYLWHSLVLKRHPILATK